MDNAKVAFSTYQKCVVALLAFLQFTIILDFMIMSPLGATVMFALKVTPSQFGAVVSAYAFSAGISGILAAGFADRFDRKKLLLFFYSGFVLGTLLCGVAPSFHFLMFARMITGLFGGVIGSVVFAITADLFFATAARSCHGRGADGVRCKSDVGYSRRPLHFKSMGMAFTIFGDRRGRDLYWRPYRPLLKTHRCSLKDPS